MKMILDSTPCLVHLLLLAQLFVSSASRPAHNSSTCGRLRSMIHQLDCVIKLCKSLYDLDDSELSVLEQMEHRLPGLPSIEHTPDKISSLPINESLPEMHAGFQAFKTHVDWLATVRHNVSLNNESTEKVKGHLLHLINASLYQVSVEVTPTMAPPSFPAVSTAFDALQFSIEVSGKLKVFCLWSKTILRHLQLKLRCTLHNHHF